MSAAYKLVGYQVRGRLVRFGRGDLPPYGYAAVKRKGLGDRGQHVLVQRWAGLQQPALLDLSRERQRDVGAAFLQAFKGLPGADQGRASRGALGAKARPPAARQLVAPFFRRKQGRHAVREGPHEAF